MLGEEKLSGKAVECAGMKTGFWGTHQLQPHLDHFPAVWPQRGSDDDLDDDDISHFLIAFDFMVSDA